MRSLLLSLLLAAPVAAQTTVTVGVSHTGPGGTAGEENQLSPSATVLAVEGRHRIGAVGVVGLSLGGALRAAVTEVFEGERGAPALHNAELYLAAQQPLAGGGEAEALAGVALDLGPDLFEGGFFGDASASTDAVHALRVGARAAFPRGPLTVSAGADAFLTPVRRVDVLSTGPDVPSDSTVVFRVHQGHALGVSAGAAWQVGSVALGLTLRHDRRTGRSSDADGDAFPASRDDWFQVLSVVPSATWRLPGGATVEVAMRTSGVLWAEHATLGVPLLADGIRVSRWPLSLRVGYEW